MSQTPIESLIEPADSQKRHTGEDKGSRRVRKTLLVAALLIVGLVTVDRNYGVDARREKRETEEAELKAGEASLQELVSSIGSQEYEVEIVDGIDEPNDPYAEVKVTLGNCSGKITLFQSEAYSNPASNWVSNETGGKDNLLAIPDEFGKVLGYLPLSKQNIIASFPDSCTVN